MSEQQWWRVLYSDGSERIAGPWFTTKEEASEWALDSPDVSKRAMRSIRYEAGVGDVPPEMDEDYSYHSNHSHAELSAFIRRGMEK